MTERYTGPSARRADDPLPHRVSYKQGWSWTTTAICHGGRSDGLACRQRPDGEGIDVGCHTGNCSRGVALTHLEAFVGLPVFEPVDEVADEAPQPRPRWRVIVAGVAALVIASPVISGDGELVFLNPVSSMGQALVGLGIGLLLLRRFMRRGVRRSRR